MKLKKFASYLVTGKILAGTTIISAADKNLSPNYSTASSFANSISITPEQILSTNLSLIEISSGEAFVLDAINSADSNMYGGADQIAATINLPGTGCDFQAVNSFNVVVTGIKPGDNVYIAVSKEYDDTYWDSATSGQTQGKLKLGKDLNLIAYFKVEGQNFTQQQTLPGLDNIITGDMENTVLPINLKISLPDVNQLVDSYIYLQAVVFPEGQLNWNAARTSEVDKIFITEKNCSSDNYGSQY
jgi:hypothetical protein